MALVDQSEIDAADTDAALNTVLTDADQDRHHVMPRPSPQADQSETIPRELTFLMNEGISRDLLMTCVKTAQTWGVEPLDALLALDVMDEATLYRTLARHLNCRFIAREDEVICTLPPVSRMPQTGILPVRMNEGDERQNHHSPIRFAIAPSGLHLTQLACFVRQKRDERTMLDLDSMALTTPNVLRSIARSHAPALIAYQGANALADHHAALSIRDGLTSAQKRWSISWLFIHATLLVLIPLSMMITLMVIETMLLSMLFIVLMTLRLASTWEKHPIALPRDKAFEIPEAQLPVYTVLIPLYRETRIVPQLFQALRNLNYPSAKLDVKIIIEEGDHLTQEALRNAFLPTWINVVIAPDGQPRTKPRALNIALKESRGDFLVIYDAEDVPDPLQLRHAVAIFAASSPDVACLQARLVIDNTADSWFTKLFTIEYCQLFDGLNPTLAKFGLPVPLGGTSNHFRNTVLRDVMGWDAWNVNEDADLGFRMAQCGYRVGDLPSPTFEEAPSYFRAWLNQRTRWLKGWMQVCITHSRHPVLALKMLGIVNFLAMIALSFGTVLTALSFPFFTLLGLYTVWMGPFNGLTIWPWLNHLIYAQVIVLLILGLVAMILPARQALKRRQLEALLPMTWLLPVYTPRE
jgi:cellulose synthase/poly-beta-1,6-N-acetylglucosamine synthase-like glycosyltransferase